MPLFKIVVREKEDSSSLRPPEQVRTERPPSTPTASGNGGHSGFALVAGALSALLLLAVLSVVLVTRFGAQGGNEAADGSGLNEGTLENAMPIGEPAAPLEALAAAGVPPINGDFPREVVVATVEGVSYTMADLEVATRLARAIGVLAGDPVPNYDDTIGLIRFQVELLRRQVDVLLIENAARATGTYLSMPEIPDEDLLGDFLGRVGASRSQLEDTLAANGVNMAQMMNFLRRTQRIDFFVQSELMQGREQGERDAAVSEWLAERWNLGRIQIQFYDPDVIPERPQ